MVDGSGAAKGYGDPDAKVDRSAKLSSHIPLHIVRWIVFYASKHTGYTHQWREAKYSAYREYLMASVETAQGARDAHLAGWRTFRVRRADESLMVGEITCPASDEAGHKTQCERCGLCGGSRKTAKNVVIIAHGIGARNLIQIGKAA